MMDDAVNLYLDCEWADVLASELVSIALVSADGLHTFYAERDPLPANPVPWVRSVVYPLLERGEAAMDDMALTRRLREFLQLFQIPQSTTTLVMTGAFANMSSMAWRLLCQRGRSQR